MGGIVALALFIALVAFALTRLVKTWRSAGRVWGGVGDDPDATRGTPDAGPDPTAAPRFQTVPIDLGDLPPSLRENPTVMELSRSGVPKECFAYAAADHATVVRKATGTNSVCFGAVGPFLMMCLDPASGEIVSLIVARTGAEPHFVNSSLPLFARTVETVIARYPFHAGDASYAAMGEAARDVGEIVRAIDPPAMEPDRYWSTLVEDIALGGFATPAVPSADQST
jgi:hypothetical protein